MKLKADMTNEIGVGRPRCGNGIFCNFNSVGRLPVLLPVLPLLLVLPPLRALPPWLVLHYCRCYRRSCCCAVVSSSSSFRLSHRADMAYK